MQGGDTHLLSDANAGATGARTTLVQQYDTRPRGSGRIGVMRRVGNQVSHSVAKATHCREYAIRPPSGEKAGWKSPPVCEVHARDPAFGSSVVKGHDEDVPQLAQLFAINMVL